MGKGRGKSQGAYMAKRGPEVVEEDDPLRALHRALDYYPSPPWSFRAGAELILRLDPHATSIAEPACGEGHGAEPLREYFPRVVASDIHPHGYGEVLDFTLDPWPHGEVDWIATNPPFKNGAAFIRRGLEVATRGVAMLCRTAFIESEERYELMTDLARFCPFSERVPMQLGSWDPALSSATSYAWFFWTKPVVALNEPKGMVELIPPGTKRRLSRDEDVRRFGVRAPLPLFEGVA